jgi:hypothetical protein
MMGNTGLNSYSARAYRMDLGATDSTYNIDIDSVIFDSKYYSGLGGWRG